MHLHVEKIGVANINFHIFTIYDINLSIAQIIVCLLYSLLCLRRMICFDFICFKE